MIHIPVIFIVLLSFFLSGCGGGVTSSTDQQAIFSTSMNISKTPKDSKIPRMGFGDRNRIYVVWEDETPGHSEVYFTRSLDNGMAFLSPSSIYMTSGSSELPRMVIDRYGKIHLAWINTTGTSTGKELVYSYSTDDGETFSRPRAISNVDNHDVSDIMLTIDRFSNLLLAWVENNALFAAASIDRGQTFSPIKESQDGEPARPYAMADENGRYYLIWEDQAIRDIFLATSQDSGLTFSIPSNISVNSGDSESPVLAIQGTDAYVLWVDSTPENKDIYIRRISDTGSSATNISSSFSGDSEAPLAGFDGTGNIHVVWEDRTSGSAEVMYARSSDQGASFSEFRNLSNTATPSKSPQISVSSGVIRVLWVEEISSSNKELYLSASRNSGVSFSSPVNISETPGVSEGPLMGIDTSEIAHWVWVEGASGNREIYHRKERQ